MDYYGSSYYSSKGLPRLEVRTGEYQYIPKEQITNDLAGFVTGNVCECVCGFISSDQGFGFFHFFRKNDPEDLRERIEKDFKDSTSVKISLFGGNLINAFFPWKEKNRDLLFYSEDKNTKFCGTEAIKEMQQSLKADNSIKELYKISKKSLKFENEVYPLLVKCQKKSTVEDFFEYDFSLLKSKLEETNYLVTGFKDRSNFKICGLKDFIGYQNILKVIYTLTENSKLFDKNNIKHLNCTAGHAVIVDFNGTFYSKYIPRYWRLSYKFELAKYTTGASSYVIKNADQFIENHSLKNRADIGFCHQIVKCDFCDKIDSV